MTEYKITDGERGIFVRIIYSGRRSMGLEILPSGDKIYRKAQRMDSGKTCSMETAGKRKDDDRCDAGILPDK